MLWFNSNVMIYVISMMKIREIRLIINFEGSIN